jgi:hypothetical protein
MERLLKILLNHYFTSVYVNASGLAPFLPLFLAVQSKRSGANEKQTIPASADRVSGHGRSERRL